MSLFSADGTEPLNFEENFLLASIQNKTWDENRTFSECEPASLKEIATKEGEPDEFVLLPSLVSREGSAAIKSIGDCFVYEL